MCVFLKFNLCKYYYLHIMYVSHNAPKFFYLLSTRSKQMSSPWSLDILQLISQSSFPCHWRPLLHWRIEWVLLWFSETILHSTFFKPHLSGVTSISGSHHISPSENHFACSCLFVCLFTASWAGCTSVPVGTLAGSSSSVISLNFWFSCGKDTETQYFKTQYIL